jgi:hypothetical protein
MLDGALKTNPPKKILIMQADLCDRQSFRLMDAKVMDERKIGFARGMTVGKTIPREKIPTHNL